MTELACGLPVLGFQGRDANVSRAVIGDVGVVDSCVERQQRRFEGVVVGQLDDDAECTVVVGRGLGAGEDDVPGLEGCFGGQGDGEAWDLVRLALGQFLGERTEGSGSAREVVGGRGMRAEGKGAVTFAMRLEFLLAIVAGVGMQCRPDGCVVWVVEGKSAFQQGCLRYLYWGTCRQ